MSAVGCSSIAPSLECNFPCVSTASSAVQDRIQSTVNHLRSAMAATTETVYVDPTAQEIPTTDIEKVADNAGP